MKKYCFTMECLDSGTVFGHGGSECHGLLFHLMRDTHPDYSRAIHQAKHNPYSLGPLQGEGSLLRGAFRLQAGSEYSFTFSALTDEVESVIGSIQKLIHPAYKFRLGSADCRWVGIKEIAVTDHHQLLDVTPRGKFVLSFVSPTTFRSQGINLLFPSPEYVFNNLRERWNAFSPVPIDIGSEDNLFVAKYNLKTSLVHYAKYRMTGFVGNVEYNFTKTASASIRKDLLALARYSTFAGVGYKTGMGMGAIKFS